MAKLERSHHDIYPFIDATKNLKDSATGKTILVTGGSNGIGRSIARHFALAGATTVIITARTADRLETARKAIETECPHCKVITYPVDMTDTSAVRELFASFSKVPDVLVSNVGASISTGGLGDTDPDVWWRDWEINVKSCYLASHAYLSLLAGGPGIIINVSSSASNTTSQGLSAYGPAKSGVNRMTESIHFEHSAQGVRCVAFHPGGILDTGMGAKAPPQFQGMLHDTLDLPGGTAVYLSTPRASFLDGRFVYSNWDMEKLEGLKSEIVEKDLLKQRITLGDHLACEVVKPTANDS